MSVAFVDGDIIHCACRDLTVRQQIFHNVDYQGMSELIDLQPQKLFGQFEKRIYLPWSLTWCNRKSHFDGKGNKLFEQGTR